MIIVRLMGGMGNQMFQYAAGRSLAERHKTALKLDLTFLLNRLPRKDFVFRDYDLGIFNIVEDLTFLSRLAMKSRAARDVSYPMSRLYLETRNAFDKKYWAREKQNYLFDENVLKLPDNVYLDGYWQSYKYFENISGIIRKEFTFKADFSKKESEMAREIQSVNSVCVNIRRNDYVSNPVNSKFFEALGIDYYKQAESIIKSRVSELRFFVFSDDTDWCKNNLNFGGDTIFVGHEYAGDRFQSYLRLMTLCKYYIIPNSTFAWWAAWLNTSPDKIVIAPKKWVTDPDTNKNTDDLIPPSWIRI